VYPAPAPYQAPSPSQRKSPLHSTTKSSRLPFPGALLFHRFDHPPLC